MASNLFERLADAEVPPPPAQFATQLHDRVNRSLVGTQLIDLMTVGMCWSFFHFARALVGMISYTVTGRYDTTRKQRRR
jgi:hypothetical protein